MLGIPKERIEKLYGRNPPKKCPTSPRRCKYRVNQRILYTFKRTHRHDVFNDEIRRYAEYYLSEKIDNSFEIEYCLTEGNIIKLCVFGRRNVEIVDSFVCWSSWVSLAREVLSNNPIHYMDITIVYDKVLSILNTFCNRNHEQGIFFILFATLSEFSFFTDYCSEFEFMKGGNVVRIWFNSSCKHIHAHTEFYKKYNDPKSFCKERFSIIRD